MYLLLYFNHCLESLAHIMEGRKHARSKEDGLSKTLPDPKKSSVELIDASRLLDAGEGGNLLRTLLDLHQLHPPL